MTAHQFVTAIRLKAAFLSCEFYVRSNVWCQHLLLTLLFTPWQIVFIKHIEQKLSKEKIRTKDTMTTWHVCVCFIHTELCSKDFNSCFFHQSFAFFCLTSPFHPFAALHDFKLLPFWRNSSNVVYRIDLFFRAPFFEDPSPCCTRLGWMCCESKREGWYCKSIKNKCVYKFNEKPWTK